jgi:spermidine/putrescine transport system permease protein
MKRQSFLSILFLALVLLVLYLPVITVVVYSFNENPSRTPLEFTGLTTRWYADLFSGVRGYGEALVVSLRVAVMSTALAIVIGTLGAVGMSQRSLIQKKASASENWMESLITLPIMIPEIILAMSFMSVFYAVGIPMGEMAMVLAHTTFCIPYLFLTVKSRLVGMDPALFDAARDLGANPRRVLLDITLPLIRPAILSGAFLAFAMSMDDFIISFFVSSVNVPLPVKVYSSVKVGVSPQVNALCTLMIAVAFLAMALSQYVSSMRAAKLRH